MFYPKAKKGELTEDQKQVIDNLVVVAGSAAGGLASGSLSGVGSGANTAKNEVENNSLSGVNGLSAIFGSQGATYFVGTGSKAEQMRKDGATPDEMSAEFSKYILG